MRQFQLPSLDRLPDFPKSEYWAFIQDLGQSLEELSHSYEAICAELKERDQQLEEALAQIAALEAQLSRPQKTSENASVAPSQDRQRLPATTQPKAQAPARKRTGHQP